MGKGLRLRQVFEHPTHFKVVKPIGNPMIIAKKGLSPSLQGRLRKFAEGGEVSDKVPMPAPGTAIPVKDESSRTMDFAEPFPTAPTVAFEAPLPSQPRSAEEIDKQIEELKKLDVEEPAAVEPVMVAPAPVAVAPAAPVVVAAAPAPVAVTPTAPVVAAPTQAVVVPAPAAPAQEVGPDLSTAAGQISAAASAAIQEDRAQREAQSAALIKQAEQREKEAADYKRISDEQAAKAKSARELQDKVAADLANMRNVGDYFSRLSTPSKIGTALSLAMGAFASGLGNVPNVALHLYQDAVNKDIEKQKEDRNSLWNQFVRAGHSAEEADQYVRSTYDKAMAAQAAAAAARTSSEKVKQGLGKFAADMIIKANTATSSVERNAAQQALAEHKLQQAPKEEARQEWRDQMAELARLEEMRHRGVLEAQGWENLKRLREVAKKGTSAFAVPEGATDYDRVKAAFDSQGAKGAIAREKQTIRVDGEPLLVSGAMSPTTVQQRVNQLSEMDRSLGDVLEVVKKHPFGAVLPSETKGKINAVAGATMLAYPKLEGFARPLNLADKEIVKSMFAKPGSVLSGITGESVAALDELQRRAREDMHKLIQSSSLRGDPNREKLLNKYMPIEQDLGVTRSR